MTNPIYEITFRRKRIGESLGQISTPTDAVDVIHKILDHEEQEQLLSIALDTKNQVIGFERVYRGNVAGSSVRVAEVLKLPVRLNAPVLIIAHNHPSGDPTPSFEDIRITEELRNAGKLLDIELLDHIIVSDNGRHQSLRALGHFAIA